MAGDAPISGRAEDGLGRARFADSMAVAVRGLDAAGGAVVALFGPWGIGKTSVLNMIIEALAEEPPLEVVQFNPWLFSGTDQLLAEFFTELASQLRLRPSKREKIADLLDAYGEGLASLKTVPVVGLWAGLAGGGGKLAGRLVKRKAVDGLTAQRGRLRDALARLDRSIVVVIDDIDRLHPQEILDILRLVRLTGSFPNLIYLLAFDRGRVELILGQQGFEGGPYLEKIVEYGYDVPAIPPTRLQRILTDGIDDATAGLSGTSGADRWPDIFYRVVRPLFGSLRDVKRYLAVLPTVLNTVGDEVSTVDVLALEAVRVVLPGTYASLISLGSHLAGATGNGQDNIQAAVDRMLDSVPTQRDAIRDLCRLLFPGSERILGGPAYGTEYLRLWRRERRVASPEVFAFYLTRTLEPGTASAGLVASAFAALSNEESLRTLFDSLDSDTLEDLLPQLEAYGEEVPEHAVEPAVAAMLYLYGRLPSRPGVLVGPHIIVNRVILRMFRRLPDKGVLAEKVGRLFENAPTLQARFHLVRLVGHRPNTGHRLIPQSDAERLEVSLYHTLLHTDADLLAVEHEILLMLTLAIQNNPNDREDLDRELQDPLLARALVKDALGATTAQSLGSFNVQHQDTLDWDALLIVFGSAAALATAVERPVDASSDTGESQATLNKAMDLAHRYLTGWRPNASWLPPMLNKVAAQNGPRNLLRPDIPTGGLVVRAVARHRLDANRADQISLASNHVHTRMREALADAPILDVLGALAASRGLPVAQTLWQPGPDQDQGAKLAVETIRLAGDGQAANLQARCGVIMPGMTDAELRVLVEVLVALPTTEALAQPDLNQMLPLTLSEVRDLTSAALRTAEVVDRRCLRELVGVPSPPRSGIETHLVAWDSAQKNGTPTKQSRTLADVIDLSVFGKAAESHWRQEGAFASNEDWDLREPSDVDRLTVAAITSMGRDWGILNIDEVLSGAFGNMPEKTQQ